MGIDSSFARLLGACRAAPSRAAVDTASPAETAALRAVLTLPGALREPQLGAARDVLIAAASRYGASAAFARRGGVASAAGRASYRFAAVEPADAAQLDQSLREVEPRLMLIDVELCALLGLSALRQLRRQHPGVEWLLGWDEPSPRWTETIVHSRARGCVEWDLRHQDLARAFDAVMGGQLWFSRTVTQWLYATLIGAEYDDGGSRPLSQWELTPREAEVLALASQGLTNKHIAQRMDISVNTVKKHLASAFDKRGLRSRRQTMG